MNMTGTDVRAARERRGWQQEELAARLGVSQGYVSLFESGQRPVSKRLAARLVSLLSLSPSALPVSTRPKPLPNQQVARALGRLGYPGFAYLRSGSKVNPMEALLGALLADDVDWVSPATLPQGGHFQGKGGVGDFFQGVGGAWSALALDIENVRLHRVAVTDPLTGAYNREFLHQRLPQENEAALDRDRSLSIANVDV